MEIFSLSIIFYFVFTYYHNYFFVRKINVLVNDFSIIRNIYKYCNYIRLIRTLHSQYNIVPIPTDIFGNIFYHKVIKKSGEQNEQQSININYIRSIILLVFVYNTESIIDYVRSLRVLNLSH